MKKRSKDRISDVETTNVSARNAGARRPGAASNADESPSPAEVSSKAPNPIVLGVVSGLLLWCSFPPAGWRWLVWIAVAPLFSLVVSRRSPALIYLGAWLGGEVFWLAAIRWVSLADESARLGWIVMATFLSLFWILFVRLARVAHFRFNVPLLIAAPVVWTGLEQLRAYALTGFPWYNLAHALIDPTKIGGSPDPLIQIADIAGAIGVSLIVATVNAYCAEWFEVFAANDAERVRFALDHGKIKRGAIVLSIIICCYLYGVYRISQARFKPGPRIAVLQTDIVQRYRDTITPVDAIAKFEKLTTAAISSDERPDLIVWPETAYPYGYVTIDPEISNDELNRQAAMISDSWNASTVRERRADVMEHVHSWTDRLGASMLLGATHYVFGPGGPSRFNGAILLEPRSLSIQAYHKLHLVPFGEYVPLVDVFPWLTMLTPYRGRKVTGLTFGERVSILRLKDYRFAVWICFEDTLPYTARRFFAESTAGDPDFVINQSNDGWFHGSEEHDMHLAISVFRAIENRTPIARAVNLGISAFIDGNGVIEAEIPKKTMKSLTRPITLDDRSALYSKLGDWPGGLCLVACGGLLVAPMILRGNRTKNKTDSVQSTA